VKNFGIKFGSKVKLLSNLSPKKLDLAHRQNKVNMTCPEASTFLNACSVHLQ